MAAAIAANAATRGMVIAASEPSTSTSTTIATRTPISSPALVDARWEISIACPPSSTCSPVAALDFAVSTTRWASFLSRSTACLSKRIVA
jgi:hypothetical protein